MISAFFKEFFVHFWTFLGGLAWWQATIVLAMVLILVFLRNHMFKIMVWFGDIITSSSTKTRKNCERCIKMILMKSIMAQSKMSNLQSNILKDQMNVAEQKLSEIKAALIQKYAFELQSKRISDHVNNTNRNEETIQYKLFLGILNDALFLLKDEIRRCFKENGFHDKDGESFSFYVKDRVKNFVFMISNHFRNLYPTCEMLIDVDRVIELVNNTSREIEDIIFEMYVSSKQIKKDNDGKIMDCENELIRFINKEVDIDLPETRSIKLQY